MTIGIHLLPNQRHKLCARTTTDYHVLVAGQRGLGKTTLLATLLDTSAQTTTTATTTNTTSAVESSTSTVVEKQMRVRLTRSVCHLADAIDNSKTHEPLVRFLDSLHRDYARQRRENRRSLTDTRVHLLLYLVDPTGHSLSATDLNILLQLHTRVNLVVLVAKADTVTPATLVAFKQRILACLEHHQIRTWTPDQDDADSELLAAMPLAVIGASAIADVNGAQVLCREYRWGRALVDDPVHCDIPLLRNLVVRFL